MEGLRLNLNYLNRHHLISLFLFHSFSHIQLIHCRLRTVIQNKGRTIFLSFVMVKTITEALTQVPRVSFYLFLEREMVHPHTGEKGRERESLVGSVPIAEPDTRLSLMTRRS